MTIYEIDTRIEEILNPKVDPETGELIDEIDFGELEQLQMDRQTKIINCMLAYKNMNAEADAIEAEAKKLTERARKIRNRANGAYNYADQCLDGEEIDDPRVVGKYSSSKTTEVDADFIAWAKAKGREDLIRQKPAPDPEPDKKAILAALNMGDDLDGHAWREQHRKLKIS